MERIHTDRELVDILKAMGGRRRGLISAAEQLALREAAAVIEAIGELRKAYEASPDNDARVAAADRGLDEIEEPKRPWLDPKPKT